MIKEIQAKTPRDRQWAYYYAKLDHHFLGLRARYEKAFASAIPPMPRIAPGWSRSSQNCADNTGLRQKCQSSLPRNVSARRAASRACSDSIIGLTGVCCNSSPDVGRIGNSTYKLPPNRVVFRSDTR